MLALSSLFVGLVPALTLLPAIYAAGSLGFDLAPRQVINANVCATVDLTLLGTTFAQDVCICAAAGALTPASLTTLNTQITANEGVLALPLTDLGSVANAVTRLAADTLPLVLAVPTSCLYPENSVPNACGSCSFDCAAGFKVCGDLCIPEAQACVSGRPAKKRTVADLCPMNSEACMLPSSDRVAMFTGRNYECINTLVHIESCGGCVYPLPGRPTGTDCTAIPGVASVSCQLGQCVIEDCEEGYSFDGSECAAVDISTTNTEGEIPVSEGVAVDFAAALEQAAHMVIQI